MKIIFATQNPNKVEEIQNQLADSLQIQSLLDLDYTEELEESKPTLQGNALQKARFVAEKFGNCFADDTGLEIEALNGEPGVYSARYGGPEKSFEKNINLVLEKLKGKKNRKAHFRTVIALIIDGEEHLFEGICKGVITKDKSGEKGFGYDPIFKPEGFDHTFAQMSLEEKSTISHRGRAVRKLIKQLNEMSDAQRNG